MTCTDSIAKHIREQREAREREFSNALKDHAAAKDRVRRIKALRERGLANDDDLRQAENAERIAWHLIGLVDEKEAAE